MGSTRSRARTANRSWRRFTTIKSNKLIDYGIFRDDLEAGTYKVEDLYQYIVEHIGKDNEGYFMDSDGFYFLEASIRKLAEKVKKHDHEKSEYKAEIDPVED